ncbi:MAG: hypothetical protein Q7U91_10605 [Sideroxyarcus sp.]|nr:hypothetical protein [Sideroxyarcus sp.]
MDPHTLVEQTTGLASRVNNLVVQTKGQKCRQLMEQQDNLTKLAMAAIVKDLDAGQADYTNAVALLTSANTQADAALTDAAQVAKTIQLVSQAISAVAKVVG